MIGFFDSGLGGLTILQEILKQHQNEYVYLGDNVRAPYGARSQEEIFLFTTQGVKWLIDQGCTLIVLACNTASANALRKIQQEWLPMHAHHARILGILAPTVEAITSVGWSENATRDETLSILVFATPSTVASGAYQREIQKRLPNANVICQACPELVRLIEDGATEDAIANTIKQYVNAGVEKMGCSPDVVLLGCTHYALVTDVFRLELPVSARIISQPCVVAQSLGTYLIRHSELKCERSLSIKYFTTGDPTTVSAMSQRFSNLPTVFKQVLF